MLQSTSYGVELGNDRNLMDFINAKMDAALIARCVDLI
jgi:hypothetical protein